MKVLGTAGHVDHGKSTLVLALTGINPDRLKEEQDRQMTIDLGFAWMSLPDGEDIGIVDVPGHRDFIENMLAGVGGIDAAMLVIAADEGVMPQTREHLAILDLLEIERGLVALTKVDLVEEDGWLDLVQDEIQQLLRPTRLDAAEIIPVSSVTGEGLDELKVRLGKLLTASSPRMDRSKPRLPIDRVFSIPGFGTVVTGTLLDGQFDVGQDVEVLPKGIRSRIRGLQTHKAELQSAVPGSRSAVNISGVEVAQISRGDVLVCEGSYPVTSMLDVRFRLLPDADHPLKHDQRVKFFIGAAQRLARVRLLGEAVINPGESGWLQLMLDAPVVAVRGDRYILRRPSPGSTLGGGRVADPHPKRRHRLKDQAVIQRLEQLITGTPGDILLQSLSTLGPIPLKAAIDHAGLDEASADEAITEAQSAGMLISFGDGELLRSSSTLATSLDHWNQIKMKFIEIVSDHHRKFPLKLGMPREELKSRSGLDAKIFTAVILLLQSSKDLDIATQRVMLPGYEPVLSPDEQHLIDQLMQQFSRSNFSPPSVKESHQAVGIDLYNYLLDSNVLLQVSNEVVFSADGYQAMISQIRLKLERDGKITIAEVRDLFSTSRKYALGLMEFADASGITVREGDYRRLA
jgi:selenocysteine-specific elongation factor